MQRRVGAAAGEAQVAERAEVVDRVQDARPSSRHSQLGALAARARQPRSTSSPAASVKRSSKPPSALEQLAGVGDVAGLKPVGSGASIRCVRPKGPRSGPSAGFGRVGPWITAPGARRRARAASLEPSGARLAVIVGEGDQRRRRPARQADVAGGRGAAAISGRATLRSRTRRGGVALGEQPLGLGIGAVDGDDHLEGRPASVCAVERVEQAREPGGPAAGRDRHGDLACGGRTSARMLQTAPQ